MLLRLGERRSLAGVYKPRPSFEGLAEVLQLGGEGESSEPHEFEFRVPDAFGFGIAARLHEHFTVNVDAERSRYSQLAGAVNEQYDTDVFLADDGFDVRAGAEYVLLWRNTPVGLRAGLARAAPSNLYGVGGERCQSAPCGEFPVKPDDAALRLTLGAGAVLADRWQLDSAAVLGEDRTIPAPTSALAEPLAEPPVAVMVAGSTAAR